MKKILINGRFLAQEITGVQRFALEISKVLKKYFGDRVIVLSPLIINSNRVLADELEAKEFGLLTGHLWEQVTLPIYLKLNNNPILLNLTNSAPVLYNRSIATFCDVSPLSNPEWYSKSFSFLYKFLMPKIGKNCLRLLTISEFSKNEILKFINIDPCKIEVIYCALPSTLANDIALAEDKKKYFLCVSSLNPRKNFERIISAFNKIQFKDYELLIVGGVMSNFAEMRLTEIVNGNNKIKFLGRVSDEKLNSLYFEATGFIYASLYEGFGIPPLEAQSHGCPVLASDIDVHREILNDSVIYCSPLSIISITTGLEKMIKNDMNDFINRGKLNFQRFSWEESAKKIIEIIKEVEN